MNKTTAYTNSDTADTTVSPVIGLAPRELISTIVTGMVVGLIAASIAILMNRFVFGAVLCRADAANDCNNAPMYAMIVGLVVATIAGLVALAQQRVYRPLLIVLAAAAALWGFHLLIGSLVWYWSLIVAAIVFGLVYGLFMWLARIRSFILALVVIVVAVVIIRLVLVA